MRPVVELIVVDSGGGHRAAATALSAVIHDRALNWDRRVTCIQDLLEPIDVIHLCAGVRPRFASSSDIGPNPAPTLVVSLVPHFNRAIKQSLVSTLPGTPFVTVLTDIADYPLFRQTPRVPRCA